MTIFLFILICIAFWVSIAIYFSVMFGYVLLVYINSVFIMFSHIFEIVLGWYCHFFLYCLMYV